MPRTRHPSLRAVALVALRAVSAVMAGTGCAVLPEPVPAPAQPVPIAPADGGDIVANARTRFVWAPVPGARSYDFHVFDRSTRDIGRYRVDELRARDVCDARACSVQLSVSLPRMKDHAWRVRARNRAGVSGWSRARFAMVDAAGVGGGGGGAGAADTSAASRAPAVPVVVGPVGATLRAGDVARFEWRVVDGASGYDFHLFDATTRDLVGDARGLDPEAVCDAAGVCAVEFAPPMAAASNHAWRVRAVNGYGASGWTRTVFALVR